MNKHLAIVCSALLLCFGAQSQNEAKPHRRIKGLPRYMTDIPQPIPDELKLPDAPKTVRDVSCYTSFTTGSSMQDVVRKCGVPDEHQGSGIYIFLYDMSDGSVVAIGTSEFKHLMYVNHIQVRSSRSLLHRGPGEAFSITLERTACLGSCPDYKITIRGNGAVRYEGHAYVSVEGIRNTSIPVSVVETLRQKLRDEDFLHWPEQKEVCVDFPEVNITATLEGQRKHVLEGCNQPGKVLQLAIEIDRISGAVQWTGKRH
jgi:hypothetical protein